jgi:hypothetical protein
MVSSAETCTKSESSAAAVVTCTSATLSVDFALMGAFTAVSSVIAGSAATTTWGTLNDEDVAAAANGARLYQKRARRKPRLTMVMATTD